MAIVYSITIIAFICCLLMTPFVISMCKKHGLVDVPKDSRRVHSKPMPRCGGIAIFASSMIGLLIYYLLTKDIPSIAFNMQFVGYLIGAILIFAMGIIDDIFTLRAKYKFVFELASILVVYFWNKNREYRKFKLRIHVFTNYIFMDNYSAKCNELNRWS